MKKFEVDFPEKPPDLAPESLSRSQSLRKSGVDTFQNCSEMPWGGYVCVVVTTPNRSWLLASHPTTVFAVSDLPEAPTTSL